MMCHAEHKSKIYKNTRIIHSIYIIYKITASNTNLEISKIILLNLQLRFLPFCTDPKNVDTRLYLCCLAACSQLCVN